MRYFSWPRKVCMRFFDSCATARDLSDCPWLDGVPAGQALSLRIRRAGVLHSTSAGLWLTLSPASADASVRGGDHVLAPGQGLALAAGQRVVLEPWSAGMAATFAWEPAIGAQGAPQRAVGQRRRAARALNDSSACAGGRWYAGQALMASVRRPALFQESSP